MCDVDALRSTLAKHEQEHLLQYWDSLDEKERSQLCDDIDAIDFETVVADFKKVTSEQKTDEKINDLIKPVPKSLFGDINRTPPDTLKKYEDDGLRLIAEGKVAVLVLAGGQGTRLGVSYPKGMYDLGLPSRKTLYQLQAERIAKLQRLAHARHNRPASSATIPWFIMTSDSTGEQTRDFFERHAYFGLRPDDVLMFRQFELPAFAFDGRIILERRHRVSMAADGNGGLYRALRDRRMLRRLEERGVRYVHAFSVDNALLRPGDPTFVGYCASRDADCGVKVIEKREPSENIGVVCLVDGRPQVVEYSELSADRAAARDEDGGLLYRAGNICNHLFEVAFLRRVAEQHAAQLPLHVAKKKIPYADRAAGGATVRPDAANGIKMERFIFDAFPYAQRLAVWETNRDDEFSALKNGDEAAVDCPATARRALYRLHRRWIERAGGRFEASRARDEGDDRQEDGGDVVVCEISPYVSYGGENLEPLVSGKTFGSPTLLKADSEP